MNLQLQPVLSRVAAKPYRSAELDSSEDPVLDEHGQLAFSPDDLENPRNWSAKRRWYITIVSVSMVMNATFASSAPSGCIESIADHFRVSVTAAQLTVTLFLMGYCAGPLFFAPLSEFYGRRYLFDLSFVCYIAFNFLCAFAPNFGALLVGRFLTGTFVSCALSNAPGVLADLWDSIDRGNAMAVYSIANNTGPALGPIVAGFLQLKKDWRWAFYVLLWLGAATAVFVFTIPETLPAVVLLNKARRIRKLKIPGYENVEAPVESTDRSLKHVFQLALTRPWLLLLDPISFFIALYMLVVYALLYMLFTIYPVVFIQKRGWNSGVGELPLLGSVIGGFLGGFVVVLNSKYNRKRQLQGHHPEPEDRLFLVKIGGIGFAVTMFWFAWTGEYNSVHWVVPALAGVFLTASIMLIFVSCINYLTDTYLEYSASAVAANTIVRSAAGAAAPLFTQQMFDKLGVGGGGSVIGGVAALLAVIPFVFSKYGKAIRERSKFAPTKAKSEDDQGTAAEGEKDAANGSAETPISNADPEKAEP